MNKLSILIMTVFLIALTSCDSSNTLIHLGKGKIIKGSGNVISKERDVADFHSIEMSGSLDVVITRGDTCKCVVKADDNIVPLIRTEVKNDQLQMNIKKSCSTQKTMTASLEMPYLESAVLSGSGDLQIREVLGDSVSLAINGSGDVTATGEVRHLAAQINGSGDLDLGKLQAVSAEISINGSGDADVWVLESLAAKVNGSGNITYSGNPPEVEKTVRGSGDIEPK
jgi:Putative auto-transporter adhesin, head GIN domain